MYVDLPDVRRAASELVVRARTTSSVHTMRVGLNAPENFSPSGIQPPSQQAVFSATFQTLGGVTPIVRDGQVHTYRIHLPRATTQAEPMRRLGLQFQALVPGTIDILSVRLIAAVDDSSPGAMTETTLEPRQLKTDFALFRQSLEEAHPALYRYTTKRALDALLVSAEARLGRPMTLLQFRNVLAPVRAAIKDGGSIATTFQGDEVTTIVNSAEQFPLALTFLSTRGFVLLNQGLDDRVKPGMEVLAINGQSFAAILQRILPNVGQYGDVRTWPMYQLGIPGGFSRRGLPGRTGFGEAYRLYLGNPSSFRTTLRDPKTRQTRVVDLAGVTLAEASVNVTQNAVNRDVRAGLEALRTLATPQSIRYLDGEATAVLVPAWGTDAPAFLKVVFAELKSRNVKNLIIDVRGNTGGFDQIPVLLFSYLATKEFRAIDRVYMKTYQPSFSRYTVSTDVDPVADPYYGSAMGIWKPDPGGGWLMTEKYPIIGLKQPAEDNFDGAVYVLTDGGSISATAEFCATVDYYQRATFIGEETGGAAEGDTGGGDISPTLPESHLQIRIPGEAYFSVVDRSNRRRGTLPKYTVVQTVDDLARGRDTVLEFTRALIRKGRRP
jgi:C-terminal processing protease CtpA/Prc